MNQSPVIPQQNIVDRIMYWICDDGKNKAQTKALIKAELPDATDDEIADLIQQAFTQLAEIHSQQNDPVQIIRQHIEWYEQIYDYFHSINHAAGKNKALQAKERLLGILKEGNRVTLKKSETVVNRTYDDVQYDFNRLTPEEKADYDLLISIAKK